MIDTFLYFMQAVGIASSLFFVMILFMLLSGRMGIKRTVIGVNRDGTKEVLKSSTVGNFHTASERKENHADKDPWKSM